MSLARAGDGSAGPPALPRGAVLVLLAVALGLHVALAAAIFRSAPRDGAEAAGQGGLSVGLGPSGAPPGAAASVAPQPAEAVPPEAQPALEVGAAPAAPEVSAAETLTPVTPRAPALVDAAEPARAVPRSVTASSFVRADPAPERVLTATPQEGVGVSPRPRPRPQNVEAAATARPVPPSAAPAARLNSAAGSSGEGGASEANTRGSGDGTDGGGSPGARADFTARVAARLARAKQYPRAAQDRRLEGTGVVWFRIDAAGRVTASRLSRSTGHATLDAAIMATLRRARLPAIPASLGQGRMEFSVPMAFRLR